MKLKLRLQKHAPLCLAALQRKAAAAAAGNDLPPFVHSLVLSPLLSLGPSFILSFFLQYFNIPVLLFLFQIEDMRLEVQRKEQDLMQLQAKMKTVEEQHADYQKHIAVLKESLIAKEEHYNMLQMDVSSFTNSPSLSSQFTEVTLIKRAISKDGKRNRLEM